MKDDEKDKDIEEVVDEVNEEAVVEPDVITTTPGLETPGDGILDKIANVFRKTPKEEVEGVDDETIEEEIDEETDEVKTETEEEEIKTSEYVEIDPRFSVAAKAYGWSNDRIIQYANEHEDIDIITLAGRMEELTVTTPAKKEETLIDEAALDTLAEADPNMAQMLRGIVEPMAKRFKENTSELETLRGQLGTHEQDRVNKEEVRNQATADELFDASEITALGKTSDIPKYPDGTYVVENSLVAEREKIWKVAQQFYAGGGSFREAVTNAMQWYSGGSAKKDAKRNVIKELKDQEKRVMPKRQETKVEKTYANEEERKAAIINDAVRKYNKEFSV